MPDLKRKSRTISLRLSEQEYEVLKVMYSAHGARSISDFARTAMKRIISCEPANGASEAADGVSLELKVQELDGKVNILDNEVARLTHLIESEIGRRSGGMNEQL